MSNGALHISMPNRRVANRMGETCKHLNLVRVRRDYWEIDRYLRYCLPNEEPQGGQVLYTLVNHFGYRECDRDELIEVVKMLHARCAWRARNQANGVITLPPEGEYEWVYGADWWPYTDQERAAFGGTKISE